MEETKTVDEVKEEFLAIVAGEVSAINNHELIRDWNSVPRMLRKALLETLYNPRFEHSLVVETGGYKSQKDFLKRVVRKLEKDSRCDVSIVAKEICRKTTPRSLGSVIGLVDVRVEELGFDEEVTLGEILNRAGLIRLNLVPPEAALQIHDSYRRDPFSTLLREGVTVAMEPVKTSSGGRVFYLTSEANYILTITTKSANQRWGPKEHFLFAQHH